MGRRPGLSIDPVRYEKVNEHGRHACRALVEFHERHVGQFHRWLSRIILGSAAVFSVGGLLARWNKLGEWLLVITTSVGLLLICRSAHPTGSSPQVLNREI